jgi:hypothetical protein
MAVITPIPKTQFIGADGAPLVGGKVYTYQAGTTSPQVTYTDSTGSDANTNPIILDSRGEANIWLGEATYKFKLTDANDVEIWTVDYISAPTTAVSPVLTGNVTISTDSSGPALKITQTGTGDVLRVQDSVDPDLTPFVINAAGLVGLGTVAPAEALDLDNNGRIQFSANGTPRTVISADATNSTIDVRDARNLVLRVNSGNRLTIASTGMTTLANGLTVSASGAAITGNSSVAGTLTATTFSGAWENLPAGTVMLFVQTSAPTGWTKSTAHDNKALRVVSGSASSGGSVAFTTAFASQAVTGTVASYTLTTADIPSHNHSATSTSTSSSTSSVTDSGHTHPFTTFSTAGLAVQGGVVGINYITASTGGTTSSATTGVTVGTTTTTSTSTSIGNTGGGGGHAHGFSAPNINLAVQYVDVIIATKN